MVFAIAALLLQASPVIQPAIPAASSVAVTATLSAAVRPDPADPDKSAVIVAPTADNAATVRMNLEPVKLDISDSKQKPGYSLNSVSLETPQNSKSFETIRIPEPNPGKQIGITSAESYPSRKTWLALAVAEHSAAFFDAYSTRRAISRGAVEDDPMMRPFANSGAIYAAIQVGPVLLDLVSHKMQHSENGFVRRMWWVPQSVATSTYLFSAGHNMGVSKRPN
jgi:hypothetical protein